MIVEREAAGEVVGLRWRDVRRGVVPCVPGDEEEGSVTTGGDGGMTRDREERSARGG